MPNIRRARPDEAAIVSALAQRSKAHWDYTADQLAVFEDELTLDPARIERDRTHVLVDGDALVGFYSLVPHDSGAVELEHLFVDPSQLRSGHGRSLFRHACELACEAGFDRMVIQSDPNAAGFYESFGARLEGEIPSSIPGRSLPFFGLALGPR